MRGRVTVEPWDRHNQALVGNVRPPDWVNPTPATRYHLVVIGGGPAGLVTAIGAAGLGARVALVERHLMGGDCLHAGCVPSKALLRAARAWADVRDAAGFGVIVPPGARVDFAAVMERMRRLRAQLSRHDAAARYRDLGVDVFLGEGRFVGPDAVAVGDLRLPFRRAVIATGARATAPAIPGLAEAGYLTSETVFSLTALPPRLAVIGAGAVGCELGQAFARFGARVTLLEAAPRILLREDAEAAARVARALERDGVRLLVDCAITGVERDGAARVLQCAHRGGREPVEVDAILVAVGRAPNVEGLGLEAAGVAVDPRDGVRVDDRLRTTNRRIFAAGDVCSRAPFTHHADFQARIVVRNALFAGRARASALIVPRCTYTDPELAHVGLDADEASARGIRVRTLRQELAEVDRAVLDGETDGFVTIHVRERDGRIVGATVVARHAGEMISELTLAMGQRLRLDHLARTIHPYPTQADAFRRLGDACSRARLTPRVARALRVWLRCLR